MGKRKKHMTPVERAAARCNPGDGAVAGREAKAAALRPTARNLESARETLTRRIVTTVEVVLVIFPFAVWGYVGLGGVSLDSGRKTV